MREACETLAPVGDQVASFVPGCFCKNERRDQRCTHVFGKGPSAVGLVVVGEMGTKGRPVGSGQVGIPDRGSRLVPTEEKGKTGRA